MRRDWFTAATAASETGLAARSIDWEASGLGSPETWPAPLRMAVELCLGTRFPALVAWGPDLVMLYNDGYAEMLGARHPGALGAPLREVWAEVWDTIGPQLAHVRETGEATWVVDQRLVMTRHGFDEETYFTYSYSPLRGDDGTVEGILDIATETTEQVVEGRRLRGLGWLSSRLHAAVDVGEVGRIAMESLASLPDDVAAADLHLATGDGHLPLLASSRRRPGTSPIGAELLRQVAATGRAALHGAALVAPLASAGEEVTGVLTVEASALRPLDDRYRSYLELVVATVSAALGAALRQASELGELRRVSDALQTSILPAVTALPGVAARYLPATGGLAVGGDWYDVLELGEGRRALLVGDCVGHGLAAAAVMGQLRSASRALLLDDEGPAATIAGLDRFARSIEGAECTTVFCAIVDDRERTLTYASAGHLPPLLLRGGAVGWLDATPELPLDALTELPARSETTIPLIGDETVVVYSDGLIERRGESLDEGLTRLADAAVGCASLPVEELADALVAALLPDGGHDDVAFLVHRRSLASE